MRHFGVALAHTAPCLVLVAQCIATISCRGASSSATTMSPPPSVALARTPNAAKPVHVRLRGCPPFYTAVVTIGGQALEMLVDTGSTTTAVMSANCPSCPRTGDSTAYRPGSHAVDTHSKASTFYGGGAGRGWSGTVIEDSVAVDAVAPRVRLVAIDAQAGFFGLCGSSGGGYQGILGLGPTFGAMPGTNGFLDQARETHAMPDVLAVELCPSGNAGHLWFGGFDPGSATAAPSYTPMTDHGMVSLSDLAVGGSSLGLSETAYGDALLDSGSPVTQLPPNVFAALTHAIESAPAFKTMLGNNPDWSIWRGCAPIPLPFAEAKERFDTLLPPLTITFGRGPSSVAIRLPASESYLRPAVRDGKQMWCSGIIEMKEKSPFIVLGSPIMQANITIFDRQNKRVGFAPHVACE